MLFQTTLTWVAMHFHRHVVKLWILGEQRFVMVGRLWVMRQDSNDGGKVMSANPPNMQIRDPVVSLRL
jgi:hypothetical protein